MPRERPVHHQALGEYFVGLREQKAWAQNEAAELAQRRGLRALSRQVLLRLERGQIKNPEPAVLKAAALLYGVPYLDIVRKFVALRFDVPLAPDLTRHDRDQQSGASLNVGDPLNEKDAIGVELQELRALVAKYEKDAHEVRTVTDALVKVALSLEQTRKAPKGKSNRGGRDRRMG